MTDKALSRILAFHGGALAGAGASERRAAAASAPAQPTPTSNTGVNNVGDVGREVDALLWPTHDVGVIPHQKRLRHSVEEKLILEGGKVKVLCAERQQASRSGVIVDYLRVTVRKDAVLQLEGVKNNDDEALCQALAFRCAGVLGFVLGESRKGRDYYDFTWTFNNEFGKEVGSVSGGGASQRDTFCLTLKGEACTFAGPRWEEKLHAFLEPMEPRITRIDLARDFLAGEVCMAEVVGHYESGSFDYRNRRPSYQQHGCWMGQDQHSRTFQVGQRESGKLMRAYEKGHQFKLMADAWLRVEVELRNVNRIIPFAALLRPADFFAGAYDFCQMVLDEKPVPEFIVTGKKVGEASVARLMAWVERVVAPTLVHISAAAPDLTWLDEIMGLHIKRKAPKSIAGLSHLALTQGVTDYLKRVSESVPARLAFS